MCEINEKNPDKPLASYFAQYHDGSLEGLQVKGIYTLKLSLRRGLQPTIAAKKEVVDIPVEVPPA